MQHVLISGYYTSDVDISDYSMTGDVLVFSTLKQKVIILLARLFPLKRVCMESASSTSLENMFHSSW